jgi:hypothetical protein
MENQRKRKLAFEEFVRIVRRRYNGTLPPIPE